MKKVMFIYNPTSGRQIIQRRIDNICIQLLNKGYLVSKYATTKKDDAMNRTIQCCKEDWDILLVSGGDGTVNEVAAGIVEGGRKIPVGILASGTVNDFAKFMNLPRQVDEFCEMIFSEKTIDVDLGKCNDLIYVNVSAGGLLTNVAHQASSELKTILGRMAYYIEGIKEIPKQRFIPIRLKFTSKEYSEEEDVLLFLVSNSASIGGFKKFAPSAEVQDGYLDCVIIKKSEIQDIISICLKVLRGEHVNHPNVAYFKTKELSISNMSEKEIDIDIDGEYAGKLPVNFKVIPKAFKIFVL
ncbi:diacylglycerol/lipid kinase family protein [Abyssisolibacter fermentans]|uniref:diacylglycerol/lipid kinase family protein n=1 Tax=Abyssisolibacter fermentans TaxID=1766203 RepID=UPI0008349130|nr:YegS/Rv2252/BmrU family lipid kinase [Abyssisolibacter fermentans]